MDVFDGESKGNRVESREGFEDGPVNDGHIGPAVLFYDVRAKRLLERETSNVVCKGGGDGMPTDIQLTC